MRWNNPQSLGKTVEATASNRPLKIAYLVPFDNTPEAHTVLDAVFGESYTRWAGVFTLILPTSSQCFSDDGYGEWIKSYDPDFVYSYVDLEAELIDQIDRLSCPIAFLKHEMPKMRNREVDWRSYLPRWESYIQPVSSISTVQSPASYPVSYHMDRPREPTIFTQYGFDPSDRFLSDNFGTSFSLSGSSNPIPGFFNTLCLTPTDLPPNIIAGTERCLSRLEAFRAISDHKATPIARLATVNSEGIPRPQPTAWSYAYRLFVGEAPLDRIHFWNSRHLGGSWNNSSNAMILEPALFEDDQLIEQLGQYLNKNNFLSHSGGQNQAALHGSSVTADVLKSFADKLRPHTWNVVSVSRTFDTPPLPSDKDLQNRIHDRINDTTMLRLTEDSTEISASEPAHFLYIPPQRRNFARGHWVVELDIQRHNNLSRETLIYSMNGYNTDHLLKLHGDLLNASTNARR